jgi:hypothetical protein
MHLVPPSLLFSLAAAMLAVKGDWRSGVALMIVVGAGAGWRRWQMRVAIGLALGYAALGVTAATIRSGGMAGFQGVLTPTAFAVLLAVIGHATGATLRQARDAALARSLSAGAQIVHSLSQLVTRARAPAPAPAPYAPGWGRSSTTTPAAPPRPRAVAATPKGWKPVVSAPRRGLFR